MGLLSRLTGKVTPQKKPTDDALLLHAMLLMCGADGSFDDQEIPTVEAYFNSVPEFEGKEFSEVYQEATKILKRFPSPPPAASVSKSNPSGMTTALCSGTMR